MNTIYSILDVDQDNSDESPDRAFTPPPLPPPPPAAPEPTRTNSDTLKGLEALLRDEVHAHVEPYVTSGDVSRVTVQAMPAASSTIYVDAEPLQPAVRRKADHVTLPDFGQLRARPPVVYDRLPVSTAVDDARFEPLSAPPELVTDDALPTDVRVSSSETLPALHWLAAALFFFGEHGRPMVLSWRVPALVNLQLHASVIAVNALLIALGLELVQRHASEDVRRKPVARALWKRAFSRYAPLYLAGLLLGGLAFFAMPFGTGNVFEALFAAVVSVAALQAWVPWFAEVVPSLWIASCVAFVLWLSPWLIHWVRRCQTMRSRLFVVGVLLLCMSLSAVPSVIYWLVAGGSSTFAWFGTETDIVYVGLRAFPPFCVLQVLLGGLLSSAVDWARRSPSWAWHAAPVLLVGAIVATAALLPPADASVAPRTSGYDVILIYAWSPLIAAYVWLVGAHKGALALALQTQRAQRVGRMAPALVVFSPLAYARGVIVRNAGSFNGNETIYFCAMLVIVIVAAAAWTEFVSQRLTGPLRRRLGVAASAVDEAGENTSLLGNRRA